MVRRADKSRSVALPSRSRALLRPHGQRRAGHRRTAGGRLPAERCSSTCAV